MRVQSLILVFVYAAAVFAQLPGPIVPAPQPAFPPAVQLYLGLTDAQVTTIQTLNADYSSFAQSKYLRMSQVQQEIVIETAKEPLDPMALGVRYAEIEAIRRQLRDELANTVAKARQALTPDQLVKVNALEDAIKLYPIYSQAASVNLINVPASISLPVGVIRTGDFVSVPVQTTP